jgi:predicted MFS family arabinose efflux permease
VNRVAAESAADEADRARRHPSRSSLRALDWLTFLIATLQTGFGPFVAVYLTARQWTELDIGSVLGAAGLVALASQVPAGALVDSIPSKRTIGLVAISAISVSALTLAIWPIYPMVLIAEVLHAVASSLLGPAVAAVSLGLVGHRAIADRLGRNARFASIGSGIAAAMMGACGYYLSDRAVFVATALLGIPALLVVNRIDPKEVDPRRACGAAEDHEPREAVHVGVLLRNRGLLVFVGCVALFQLANAAMLPIVGSMLTARSSQWAIVLIAVSIVLPQVVVATLAPLVASKAEQWGRRPLLLLGFAMLPVRGVLFALVASAYLIVAAQLFDGFAGAVFGVMTTLVVADLTKATGRFNFVQGVVGVATGIGASFSTILGGYVADGFGNTAAFLCLSSIATAALAGLYVWMPETRSNSDSGQVASTLSHRRS